MIQKRFKNFRPGMLIESCGGGFTSCGGGESKSERERRIRREGNRKSFKKIFSGDCCLNCETKKAYGAVYCHHCGEKLEK